MNLILIAKTIFTLWSNLFLFSDAHIEVPCGKPTEMELSDKGSTSLIYNEFVVYNLSENF